MIRAGIDLGCDHIRLITESDGLVYDEPCCVALDNDGSVLAIGFDALELEDVQVIFPLKQEPLAFDVLNELIEQLIDRYRLMRLLKKTTLLFSYPTGFTDVQCDELRDHLLEFGVDKVYFEQELWVAGVGACLDLNSSVSNFILNIGASTCDIGMFSKGRLQAYSHLDLAGVQIDQMICDYVFDRYETKISMVEAEQIKISIGQTRKQIEPGAYVVNESLILTENNMVEIMRDVIVAWKKWIESFIEKLDETQKQDLYRRGLVCCGGMFLMSSLSTSLQEVLNFPVYVCDDPAKTVSEGFKILLEKMN